LHFSDSALILTSGNKKLSIAGVFVQKPLTETDISRFRKNSAQIFRTAGRIPVWQPGFSFSLAGNKKSRLVRAGLKERNEN